MTESKLENQNSLGWHLIGAENPLGMFVGGCWSHLCLMETIPAELL